MVEFSADTHYRSLFLTDFFAYLHCSAPSTWSKRGLQKKKDITQTDRFGPDPEAGGSRFRTPKTPVSPQVAPKTGPATKSQILLTTRLMSTSGALTHLHSLEIAPSAQKIKVPSWERDSFISGVFHEETRCAENFSEKPDWV